MQPDEDIAPDASANDRNGNASSDTTPSSIATETQATAVEDASRPEIFLKDNGHHTRSEGQPSDGDDTQSVPSEIKDNASPSWEKEASEPEPLTLSSLRDVMAQMTKEVDLQFLQYMPSISIGNEIRHSISYSFAKAASTIAYVDHLEKTIASLKKGTHGKVDLDGENLDLDREAVDVDPPDEHVHWKLGVKRWKETRNKFGDPELIDDEEAVGGLMANNDTYDKSKGHVLINSRIYNKKRVHISTKLEIASPLLLDVLQKVIAAPPVDRSTFSEPYMAIFHHRKELQDAKIKLDGDSKDHLGVLLDFVKDQWPTVNQTIDKIEKKTIREIGYNELWLLYPRGTVVYALEDEEWLAYRVSQLEGFKRLSTGSFSSLIIDCESLKFDSTGFELEGTTTSFTILPFTNSQVIRDLRIVPEAYMFKGVETREHLVARGQRYWNYRGKGHFQEYTGNAWLTTTPNVSQRSQEQRQKHC